MTEKELIEFGHKLIVKGRTPSEIYSAIACKTSSNKILDKVLKEVFKDEEPTNKRSPERTSTLLKANRIKLNYEYSVKALMRLAATVLIVGGVTYGLSNKRVNQNEIFGWMTLAQGVVLVVLYAFVKYKGLMNLLLPAVVIYFAVWIIELLIGGIPNDLLEAYNHTTINVPPSLRLKVNSVMARLLGYIFPFLYIGLKLFLGWFIFVAYRNHQRYDALTEDIKNDLKDF